MHSYSLETTNPTTGGYGRKWHHDQSLDAPMVRLVRLILGQSVYRRQLAVYNRYVHARQLDG